MAKAVITISDTKDGVHVTAMFAPALPAEVKQFTEAQTIAALFVSGLKEGAEEAGQLTSYSQKKGGKQK
jgi:hypothetical protein